MAEGDINDLERVLAEAELEEELNHDEEISKQEREQLEKESHEFMGAFGSTFHHNATLWVRANIRDQSWFQTAIIGVIFVAGALVGIGTYDITDPTVLDITDTLDSVVLAVFIFELVVKFLAEGRRPWRFFRDSWNIFDFLIVVIGVMPFGGSAVTALRLVRLLRVLKLVRALPKLRILVMGLFKSLSSIAYIGVLLLLLFYLYAILGVSLFAVNDPIHMGTLDAALISLFQCATLDTWDDIMYINMWGCDFFGYDGEDCTPDAQGLLAPLYFVSFVVLSSMMILNLFIGVITSSMQEAKRELTRELEREMAEKSKHLAAGEELDERMRALNTLVHDIASEVNTYAKLETARQHSSVITLSTKTVLKNKEVIRGRTQGQEGPMTYSMAAVAATVAASSSGGGGTGETRTTPDVQQPQQSLATAPNSDFVSSKS